MTDINKINPKPIERSLNGFDKPFETVYELKKDEYQIPSFEEFMKDYKVDENLNYDDLNLNETQKGYGPCPDGCWQICETQVIDRNGNYVCTIYGAVRFLLVVDCLNWGGGGGENIYLTSTSTALDYAHELERGKYFNVSSEVELKCAILIRDAIRHYERGNKVNGHIKVQGKFWGGYGWSYKY